MIRHGAIAVALAATAMRAGLVKQPEMVSHTKLEERFDGPELKERIRGVAGAGHTVAPNRPETQPCTFKRKPGKRALRRARGRARRP